MTKLPPLCVHCDYFTVVERRQVCYHPNNCRGRDPVKDGPEKLISYPAALRRDPGACGPDGRWFVLMRPPRPRPVPPAAADTRPWWVRWLNRMGLRAWRFHG